MMGVGKCHCPAVGGGGGASIGQVWTRHLAPAAPASRPSLPTQFLDCACHADSALQFVSLPSAALVVGGRGAGGCFDVSSIGTPQRKVVKSERWSGKTTRFARAAHAVCVRCKIRGSVILNHIASMLQSPAFPSQQNHPKPAPRFSALSQEDA